MSSGWRFDDYGTSRWGPPPSEVWPGYSRAPTIRRTNTRNFAGRSMFSLVTTRLATTTPALSSPVRGDESTTTTTIDTDETTKYLSPLPTELRNNDDDTMPARAPAYVGRFVVSRQWDGRPLSFPTTVVTTAVEPIEFASQTNPSGNGASVHNKNRHCWTHPSAHTKPCFPSANPRPHPWVRSQFGLMKIRGKAIQKAASVRFHSTPLEM